MELLILKSDCVYLQCETMTFTLSISRIENINYFWRLLMQGEFQFLGELYFPDDKDKSNKSRIVQIDILTKEEAPDTLRMLLFDNQPSSFGMVCLCGLNQYDNRICTQQCY